MRIGVSAVIPTYNHAAFLADAIRSVRIQNWPGTEIIVVDDGSSDNTAEVLRGLAGEDLRVEVQENLGAAAARNRGIELARGKWIAFLDSDDLWLPGKLAAQMPVLEKSTGFGFSFAEAFMLERDGGQSRLKPQLVGDDIFRSLMTGPQFLIDTVVVRRDYFERLGGFDAGLRTGEDWDMWLRISDQTRGLYIPEPLCLYRPPIRSGKYPVDLLRICTLKILEKIYSNGEMLARRPRLLRRRRWIFAWHFSVLAKSYWHQSDRRSFLFYAMKAAAIHPIGLYFLAYRWLAGQGSPDLLGDGHVHMMSAGR
jgi:glycosyltransferase involved in cell wall biosynthesis